MARTVRDGRLDSRSARRRLPQRKEPHWRTIEPCAHLGYYRGARGGTWIARLRGPDGGYVKTTLGTADDVSDADGSRILSFAQAQDSARRGFGREEGVLALRGLLRFTGGRLSASSWQQAHR